jgi:hypothetical protein
MTHYYYYIESGAILDDSARLFKVGIGTSRQSQRDYLALTAFAVNHGHYFELVSEKSDEFMHRVTLSLGRVFSDIIHLSSRELCRYLKGAGLPALSNSQLLSADSQLRFLNTSYRIISNLRARDHSTAKRSR